MNVRTKLVTRVKSLRVHKFTYMHGLSTGFGNAVLILLTIGPRREKTCLRRFANNTGADQPAHSRSLISAFVICLLESIIYRLAASEISIVQLISVAKETGLTLALSDTPKTGFLALRPKY